MPYTQPDLSEILSNEQILNTNLRTAQTKLRAILDTEEIGFRDKKFYEQFANREQFIHELDRKQCLKLYGEYKRINNKVNY